MRCLSTFSSHFLAATVSRSALLSVLAVSSVAQAGVVDSIADSVSNTVYRHSLPKDPNARIRAGLNASFNHSEYATGETMSVLPQLFYDNNRLYADGSEAGVYGYKDDKNLLRFSLSYDGQSFDPDEGDTAAIKQLDERKWSALAGASYMRITPIGGIRLKVATDVLDRHNGTVASLAHLSKFDYNKWTFYPEIGVKCNDKNYNNYYYGVSQKESAKSDLPAYSAKSSVNPYANLTASYAFDDRLSGFVSQHVSYLADTQHDSPMIDSHNDLTTRIGFNYQF